jgi:hypothetical protein
LLSFA